MSTNHTPNYALSLWEASDQVMRTEFNENHAKIDAALAGKLGKIEFIKTVPSSNVSGQYFHIPVDDIDWDQWSLVGFTFNVMGRSDDTNPALEISAAASSGKVTYRGSQGIAYFARAADNPFLFLLLPKRDKTSLVQTVCISQACSFCIASCAYQDLTELIFHHVSQIAGLPSDHTVDLWGIR